MSTLFTAILLAAFWIALSGHFEPLLIGLGAASVGLVLLVLRRMNKLNKESCRLTASGGMIGYGLWLMGCVIRSNIDLARRIWHPSLPIQPSWSRVDTEVETPLERTLYANSITLTPGTLTTDVFEDHFFVHSLSQAGLDELREGEMERRIRRLGV